MSSMDKNQLHPPTQIDEIGGPFLNRNGLDA